MRNGLRESLPAILLLLIFLFCFELMVRFSLLPEFLFPAPITILKTLYENQRDFRSAFFETLSGAMVGFILSVFIGMVLAILFSLSKFLNQAVMPFAAFFQTVPVIAIAPLLVIYFGFGMPTVIAASFIVSIFPIIAGALQGLNSLDQGKVDLFRIYRASPWQKLWKLRVPSAYASVYAALKVSFGLAVIGAIAGEFVAGGGLGAMIDTARTQQRVDIVFGALVLLSFIGILGVSFLKLLHKIIQYYRPYGLYLKD